MSPIHSIAYSHFLLHVGLINKNVFDSGLGKIPMLTKLFGWCLFTSLTKITKQGINSVCMSLLINVFFFVKTWLLVASVVGIYANMSVPIQISFSIFQDWYLQDAAGSISYLFYSEIQNTNTS